MIIFGRLIAQNRDIGGYIQYVFLNLESKNSLDKYFMMVRFPNWNSDSITIGDEGYVHYEERRAGIDEWFDGTTMVKYKYDNVQFIKFVPKPKETDKNIYLI